MSSSPSITALTNYIVEKEAELDKTQKLLKKIYEAFHLAIPIKFSVNLLAAVVGFIIGCLDLAYGRKILFYHPIQWIFPSVYALAVAELEAKFNKRRSKFLIFGPNRSLISQVLVFTYVSTSACAIFWIGIVLRSEYKHLFLWSTFFCSSSVLCLYLIQFFIDRFERKNTELEQIIRDAKRELRVYQLRNCPNIQIENGGFGAYLVDRRVLEQEERNQKQESKKE